MPITTGSRLGQYEIGPSIGSGGMGEVYRARDTRLQRDVAVKILPETVAGDADRLARFEREARALAAIDHPNILAIYDFGHEAGTAYAVTELLDGQTLREHLAGGALPPRKVAEYAGQMARGLAAAHDKGIVHRDLKPENVFVTRDGRVKLLDFGLARQTGIEGLEPDAADATRAGDTRPGTVLGTIGYMSPEQVRGEPVSPRSDLFGLGAVVYEMLSGRRAFGGDHPAETMSAILKEDPPTLSTLAANLPPSLDRIVQRCLEKQPDQRFQSARDLAFALEQALGSSASSPDRGAAPTRPAPAGRRLVGPVLVGLALLAAGVATGLLLGRQSAGTPEVASSEVRFNRLTFGWGTIRAARFTPDQKTVIYGAAWNGEPIKLFLARTENKESTPLTLPNAGIFAVSHAGELAISLDHRFEGWMGIGTLARAPLLGGGARQLLGDVREADWKPDGSDLAIVRRVKGLERLEFPAGKVLYETTGWISDIRFSPDGQRLAFADHPIFADDTGSVAIVDMAGTKTRLQSVGDMSLRGLAWSRDGREVWYTGSRSGEDSFLRAVDLAGKDRLIMSALGRIALFDIAPDGRVLLGRETTERHVELTSPDNPKPRDLSLSREQSLARWVSPDGRSVVITDQSAAHYATYLRRSDGSPPVRLGDGDGYSISPDGAWVATARVTAPFNLVLHPTGPGQPREMPNPEGVIVDSLQWLPDSRRIVIAGSSAKAKSRGWILDTGAGSPPKAFTPEGVEAVRWWALPLSSDGARMVARGPDGVVAEYPVDGGPHQPVKGLAPDAVPLQYTEDGRALFVGHATNGGWTINRLDLATGREALWREIAPADRAGLRLSYVYVTPDGKSFAHSYSKLLVDLYQAEGLR